MKGKEIERPKSKSSSDTDLGHQNKPFPPFRFDEEGWEKEKQKMSEAELRMVEAFNL